MNGTAPAQAPIIDIQDVSKRFDDELVLDHVSLSVANGEFLTLLGPSGCGKTTLLRILAGFETPSEGSVLIQGQEVTALPPNRRAVNTVFQSYALFPHMTVAQNVAFGLKRKGLPKPVIAERVHEALRLVKLSGYEDRKPGQLSGGQQQRVALARAVVNRPLVLLLDEPLSALDFKLRTEMQSELKHLQKSLGISFVFVTHDQEEAFAMSDRVAVMEAGRIRQIGTPQEVYENPANLFVARFVGDTNLLAGSIIAAAESEVGGYRASVEGRDCFLATKRSFQPHDAVMVLLRPEDLRLWRPGDPDASDAIMDGEVIECTYKGATVDMLVRADCGRQLKATEFFNEDAEDIDWRPGDPVRIGWVRGWETVLPQEPEPGTAVLCGEPELAASDGEPVGSFEEHNG